ncbi:MAG: hypothetical protein U0525_02915 [Patescibacteria group bacterium]
MSGESLLFAKRSHLGEKASGLESQNINPITEIALGFQVSEGLLLSPNAERVYLGGLDGNVHSIRFDDNGDPVDSIFEISSSTSQDGGRKSRRAIQDQRKHKAPIKVIDGVFEGGGLSKLISLDRAGVLSEWKVEGEAVKYTAANFIDWTIGADIKLLPGGQIIFVSPLTGQVDSVSFDNAGNLKSEFSVGFVNSKGRRKSIHSAAVSDDSNELSFDIALADGDANVAVMRLSMDEDGKTKSEVVHEIRNTSFIGMSSESLFDTKTISFPPEKINFINNRLMLVCCGDGVLMNIRQDDNTWKQEVIKCGLEGKDPGLGEPVSAQKTQDDRVVVAYKHGVVKLWEKCGDMWISKDLQEGFMQGELMDMRIVGNKFVVTSNQYSGESSSGYITIGEIPSLSNDPLLLTGSIYTD